MKLAPGDKVRFLYGKETGVVVKVLAGKMAEVAISEGFHVTVPFSEIVYEHSKPEDFSKNIQTHPYYLQKTRPEKKGRKKATVDLHLKAHKVKVLQLSHTELIDNQLQIVSTAIITAMAEGIKELVIIHGVGTGALKKAVTEFLQKNRHIKSIAPANASQYGQGALVARL